MEMHGKPIQERIDWLFAHARRHAEEFSSPELALARKRYLAEHPTAIAALKCMDGRINLSVATQTPMGVVQPFRNLGGMFDLGWPHLGEVLTAYVNEMVSHGRRVLLLVTYHFSKGDPKRGCAGFAFDTEAAKAHTRQIQTQVSHVFGLSHSTVYPLICGFETDEEALVIHGTDGQTLDMATLSESGFSLLDARLAALLPDMPSRMRADLLPLVEGNLRRVFELRKTVRDVDIEHREWMICIGRGFDFLHMPNLALIIGPYSPDLADPIRKAAGIITANMKHERIPEDGFLLLASSPYHEPGVDRARAELKAQFMSRFAADVIDNEFPDLAERMHRRVTVMNWHSRALEPLAVEARAAESVG
jgi:hypothetical protein